MLQIYEIFSNIGTLTLLNFKISGLAIFNSQYLFNHK